MGTNPQTSTRFRRLLLAAVLICTLGYFFVPTDTIQSAVSHSENVISKLKEKAPSSQPVHTSPPPTTSQSPHASPQQATSSTSSSTPSSTPSSTLNVPVREMPAKYMEIFKKAAFNNTVIVVPVNTGMLDLAANMRCSLTRTDFDISRIVYWTLDDEAEKTLSKQGYATYRDKSLYGVSGNQNDHGGTDDYRKMMKQRPQFFIDFLSTGYDLMMIDADIVFYQSPLDMMPDSPEDIDIVYSTDAREYYTDHNAFHDHKTQGPLMPPICNGMFWMKSHPDTLAIWTDMWMAFQDQGVRPKGHFFDKLNGLDDQRGMDLILNDGRAKVVAPFPEGIDADMVPNKDVNARIRVQLLDQTQYVNGQLFMFRENKYENHLKALRKSGKDRVAVHMNWNTYQISKSEGSIKKEIYYLDGDKKCNLQK